MSDVADELSTRRVLVAGWGNGSRHLMIVGAVAIVALAVLSAALGVVLYRSWVEDEPWDPLDEYPTQQVTDVTATHVLVTAVKCANEAVDVRGSATWASVDPPGTLIPAGQGVGPRIEGCETFHYENPIPVAVLGSGIQRWTIVGTETPFDDDREGIPVAWTTETFDLVAP